VPISHPLRTIFVHIPKTAGTSVEAVLGMHGDKCDVGITPYFNQVRDEQRLYGGELQLLTASRIKAKLRDQATFREYFKFTIVRNPWERLVSTCAWIDQKWARGQELEPAQFDDLVRQLYELFLAARRGSSPLPVSHHLQPQFEYVFDEKLQPMVDFVARYETLEQDWRRICARLNVDLALPMRMRSHHRPYREYYGDETRAMVGEVYARDAQLFAYGF
jgi:hypothetical protein